VLHLLVAHAALTCALALVLLAVMGVQATRRHLQRPLAVRPAAMTAPRQPQAAR